MRIEICDLLTNTTIFKPFYTFEVNFMLGDADFEEMEIVEVDEDNSRLLDFVKFLVDSKKTNFSHISDRPEIEGYEEFVWDDDKEYDEENGIYLEWPIYDGEYQYSLVNFDVYYTEPNGNKYKCKVIED